MNINRNIHKNIHFYVLKSIFVKLFFKMTCFCNKSVVRYLVANKGIKNMKQFTKSVFSKATAYFTIAVLIFSALTLLSFSDAESISLDPFRIICILPFCICLAIANTTLKYNKIEAVTRWLVHSVLTILGAFIFLILPAELPESSGNFMGFILILFAYIIGVLLYALFSKRIKSTIKEDAKLKSRSKTK